MPLLPPPKEIQDNGKDIFQQIKANVESLSETSRPLLIKVCRVYFELIDGQNWINERIVMMTNIDFELLQKLAIDLATEAYNRDMINYVRSGSQGNISSSMLSQFG